MPKDLPPGLEALLMTGEYVYADLYAIELVTGEVLRYTTADANIVWNGDLYSAADTLFDNFDSKSTAHWKTGLDTDTWTVVAAPLDVDPITGDDSPARIGDAPWFPAVMAGALDDGDVNIHRAYFASWPTPFKVPFIPDFVLQNIFAGTVAAVDIMVLSGTANLTFNSHTDKFGLPMPRNLFQTGCRHTLFDARCSLIKSNFGFSSTCAAGTTSLSIVPAVALPGTFPFALGQVLMTSGPNAGFNRMIRAVASGVLQLIAPFPYELALGDDFIAYPGCDKLMTTCSGVYSNLANYGGQPYIPTPETAI